jgi:hypothetical protein
LVVEQMYIVKPTPIPTFPLKGKEKPQPPRAAHGFIGHFEGLTQ